MNLVKMDAILAVFLYIVNILAGPHSQVVHESRVHDITSVNVN